MPRKIDHTKLQELLEQGLNQVEIAKELGVVKSSVCKAIKRHNLAIAKVATASEAAPVIAQKKIDIIQQIRGINEKMQRHLDLIDAEVGKKGQDTKYKIQLRDQMIKYAAEIRKQMSTLLDISKTLYNAEEVQAFQRIVLQAIEDAHPVTKEKIIQALHEVRSVRRVISEAL
jgi:IS30 family transposase